MQYIDSLRTKKTATGIKLYGRLSDIMAELKSHENTSGYINLEIRAMRYTTKNGQAYSVTVMDYQPDTFVGKRAEQYRKPRF